MASLVQVGACEFSIDIEPREVLERLAAAQERSPRELELSGMWVQLPTTYGQPVWVQPEHVSSIIGYEVARDRGDPPPSVVPA